MPALPIASPALRVLSCNIQAGSSTRAYREYVTRSVSHVLPTGKRANLDSLADLFSPFDVVGLQESDPGSDALRLRQPERLPGRARPAFPTSATSRTGASPASAAAATRMLSRLEPTELLDYALPGPVAGRGVLLSRFGSGKRRLAAGGHPPFPGCEVAARAARASLPNCWPTRNASC